MLKFALIALGGGCGALLRYGVGHLVLRAFGGGSGEPMRFPLPTLLINLAGCLAFGWLFALAGAKGSALASAEARGFLFVGLLGGFTTFSTFGHEIADLTRAGHTGYAALYIALSVAGGAGLAWLGLELGK